MTLRPLLFVLAGAALLAGLFLALRPAVPPDAPRPEPQAAAEPSGPSVQEVELRVQGGRLVAGPDTIRLREGERLRLRVAADRADEFHLHGYDLELRLAPDRPAELDFVADRSGRFEYELHHAHGQLGVLEVLPR